MTDSKPSGAKTYRKTATITASQWFKMGDHPAVILKTAKNRHADEGIPWCPTLEGGHIVTAGDWIATGVQGEHWPIKPDVFAATYAEATDEPAQPDPVGYALAIEQAATAPGWEAYVSDNAPAYLSDWQRGLVAGQQAMVDAIRSLSPPADRLAVVLAMPEVRAVIRHADLERNRLINTAVTDLDRIINQHDPEVDTSINNGVWDCLDRLCAQLESRARAEDAAIADKHRSRIAGHHPDVERPDQVAQGYGNAALNIAAEIRAAIGGSK